MRGKSYDVIIVGGGFIGAATAYYLARRGTSVLLVEGKGLASGSTGACAGRAQVSECHPGLHLDLVQKGLERLEHLQEELDYNFEWRRFGNVMLVDTEHYWQEWAAQSALLAARGIPAEMWDAKTLQEAEPAVRTDDLLGAAWCLEGHVNPLKYCWAYARAARRFGAEIHTQEPVLSIERQGQRITGVRTNQGVYSGGQVLVAAGAWTADVLRTVGVELPLKSTNAMAMISEKLPPVLNNHVGVGNFYETIHKKARAVALGVLQFRNGTLYIAEAVEMGSQVRMEATPWGPPGMAAALLDRVPALAGVRVIRSWAAPSPFLEDEQPGVGYMPGFDNLFLATCFHLHVTTVPVLTDIIACMVRGEPVEVSVEAFRPARLWPN